MIPTELVPSILALTPGIEVRGSVVYSKAAGLGLFYGYVLPFFVSMLIVPVVYFVMYFFFSWLMNFPFISKIILGIRRRVSKYVDQYGLIGLTLFVALPIPGSGLYSGSIGAVLLGMKKRQAIPALYLGNLLAFSIMLVLTSAV